MTIVWPLGTPGERYLHGVRCIDTDDVMYLFEPLLCAGRRADRAEGWLYRQVRRRWADGDIRRWRATLWADPLGKRGAPNAGRGRSDEALFRVDVWDRLRYPHGLHWGEGRRPRGDDGRRARRHEGGPQADVRSKPGVAPPRHSRRPAARKGSSEYRPAWSISRAK
jgi:hypothetical protein